MTKQTLAKKRSIFDEQPLFAKIFLLLFMTVPSLIALPSAFRSWFDGSAFEAWKILFSSGDINAYRVCPSLPMSCTTGSAAVLILVSLGPILGIALSIPLIRSLYRDYVLIKKAATRKDKIVAIITGLVLIVFFILLGVIS